MANRIAPFALCLHPVSAGKKGEAQRVKDEGGREKKVI